jgi:hypothetical protein
MELLECASKVVKKRMRCLQECSHIYKSVLGYLATNKVFNRRATVFYSHVMAHVGWRQKPVPNILYNTAGVIANFLEPYNSFILIEMVFKLLEPHDHRILIESLFKVLEPSNHWVLVNGLYSLCCMVAVFLLLSHNGNCASNGCIGC